MTYRFGTFEFDAAENVLRKNGRALPLQPQPTRALALLLERADEVVGKDDLRKHIWGTDTHVDFDRGLAYCLSEVRAALGDSGDNPRFVQTLPRRGYRFVAPVQRLSETPVSGVEPSFSELLESFRKRLATPRNLVLIAAVEILALGAGAWWFTRPGVQEMPRRVVAVSIFDNETGSAEYDRLVSGLSDLVVTRLTALDPSRIGVVGNAAILRQPRNIRNLKAVAQSVKADYVALGQLQRAESGFRFITHFIRLDDENHLKANRIQLPDGSLTGLEAAVVAEFERAVREHVLR